MNICDKCGELPKVSSSRNKFKEYFVEIECCGDTFCGGKSIVYNLSLESAVKKWNYANMSCKYPVHLKQCPFCSGKATMRREGGESLGHGMGCDVIKFVGCGSCGIGVRKSNSFVDRDLFPELIEMWNRRV